MAYSEEDQSMRTNEGPAKRNEADPRPGQRRKDGMSGTTKQRRRANDLNGTDWLKKSISIWEFAKTKTDREVGHPAVFPERLIGQLLDCYLEGSGRTVLDPFMGTGTTLLAASERGHKGIGFDVYPTFTKTAAARLGPRMSDCRIFEADAARMDDFLKPGTVDMVITSPPYWNILNRRRTADNRPSVNYGNGDADIGNIADYDEFLEAFAIVMGAAQRTLRPDAYCVINVMDLRVKSRFYMLHADTCAALTRIGYILDDIVIWNRQADYNRLRPLGYPSKFRINRIHEYLLIFQKAATP